MSAQQGAAPQGAVDRASLIGAIVEIMLSFWDLPADCNDGELIAYAEILLDRIQAGEPRETLLQYLADVETGKMGMPASSAHCDIVDRSIALARGVENADAQDERK